MSPAAIESPGYSYGWATATTNTRVRDKIGTPPSNNSVLTDTHVFFQVPFNTWEIGQPNGTYQVHMFCGDQYGTTTAQQYRISAESTLVVSGDLLNPTYFLEGTQNVTVSDGKLTLTQGGTATYTKYCYIEITEQ